MSCESVRDDLSLYLYGELTIEQEQKLQDHLDACAECRRAFEREKAIHRLLESQERMPSPELLANCRRDLAMRIRSHAPERSLAVRIRDAFRGIRLSPAFTRPVGAVALVALGFFAARLTTPNAAPVAPQQQAASMASTPTAESMVRVRNVEPDSSGQVRIVLDETRQRVVTGRVGDELVNRLLLAAARESSDPGLRGESMEVLTDILRRRPQAADVREALLHALQHDPNAGVRLKALEGLKPYAVEPPVRQALSRVLLTDDNPGVRTQAIDLLIQKKEDDIVGVLQELMQRESNGYVRLRTQRALQDMNASVGTF